MNSSTKIIVGLLVSLSSFANCVDLSGVYKFNEKCESTTYEAGAKSMLGPGTRSALGVSLGDKVEIIQHSCDSISFTYTDKFGDKTAEFNDSDSKTNIKSSSDALDMTYTLSDGYSYFGFKALFSKVNNGVVMDYSQKSWNLVFNTFGSKHSNTCFLEKAE